jgi:hypothetical protein
VTACGIWEECDRGTGAQDHIPFRSNVRVAQASAGAWRLFAQRGADRGEHSFPSSALTALAASTSSSPRHPATAWGSRAGHIETAIEAWLSPGGVPCQHAY